MKLRSRKIMAVVLSAAMVLTGVSGSGITADAAKKASVTLNKKSVKVDVGKKVTLKVKKSGVKKVKSVKWTTSSKKVAKVSSKGVVTGVKKGTATITAKVKYVEKSGKNKTKNLKCKVTVNKKAVKPTASTAVSTAPAVSASAGAVSAAPVVSASPTAPTEPTTPVEPIESVEPTPEVTLDPMAKMTAAEFMEDMNQGWNLGNTLESCGYEGDMEEATAITFETLWGQPETTKKIIAGVKACGFDTIRIPVAWSNLMTQDENGDYIVSPKYLARVAKVVDWSIENGLYVVLNEHYDGGWWGMFGSPDQKIREEAMKKYKAIWTQVADYFKDYSYYLILESANEELGNSVGGDNMALNTKVDGVEGVLTDDECYQVTTEINQAFVDIVRASGGNNKYRQLLIAGFNTDLAKTLDDRYVMPTDIEENGKTKLSISIHYYNPGGFCIGEDKTQEWYIGEWGSEEDIKTMHDELDSLSKFTDQGYGVIFGEYGPQAMSKPGAPAFIKELMTYSEEKNYVPILWNNSVYNRDEAAIAYTDIQQIMIDVTGKQDIPVEEGAEASDTLAGQVVNEEESDVEVVATWEGIWTRTNNKSQNVNNQPVRGEDEVGDFRIDQCSEGLEVTSNAFWWQLFLTYKDWDKLTQPGIRVTMTTAEDGAGEEASIANFEMGYTKAIDGGGTMGVFEREDYVEKPISLSKVKLGIKPYIQLSSPCDKGASIKKIEILDIKPKN